MLCSQRFGRFRVHPLIRGQKTFEKIAKTAEQSSKYGLRGFWSWPSWLLADPEPFCKTKMNNKENEIEVRSRKHTKLSSVGAMAGGATAFGSMAIGAVAFGAIAIGALAIGKLAIGRLAVKKSYIKELHIGRLVVDELEIRNDER
jgi:hypothetical protein